MAMKGGRKAGIFKEYEVVDLLQKLCDEFCVPQRERPVISCLQMQEVRQLEDLGRDCGKTVAI